VWVRCLRHAHKDTRNVSFLQSLCEFTL
jgi:hypothetical protein